jgi:hypothetical protein
MTAVKAAMVVARTSATSVLIMSSTVSALACAALGADPDPVAGFPQLGSGPCGSA